MGNPNVICQRQTNESVAESAADKTLRRLCDLACKLSACNDELAALIDRAFGASPQDASSKAVRERSGTLGIIGDTIDDLHALADRQAEMVTRTALIV